jgi:hypothetical protein
MSRSCRESRNASPTGSSDSFMSDECPEQKTIYRKPGPEVGDIYIQVLLKSIDIVLQDNTYLKLVPPVLVVKHLVKLQYKSSN